MLATEYSVKSSHYKINGVVTDSAKPRDIHVPFLKGSQLTVSPEMGLILSGKILVFDSVLGQQMCFAVGPMAAIAEVVAVTDHITVVVTPSHDDLLHQILL
jgi:hypothetical protein